MGDLNEPASTGLSNDYQDIAAQPVNPESDRLIPRQIATGVTRGIQQLGSEKVYSDGGNNQIIVEDTSVPRVLMGDQTSFGEGFYVSKSGINVKTNTDAAQFIFNSNQNTLKIVQTSTITVPETAANTIQLYSFSHNLGYIPVAIAYFSTSTDYTPLPMFTQSNIDIVNHYVKFGGFISYAVDSTTMAFTIQNALAVPFLTFTVKYYLLQETAN
jgi:hypothetical protein